MVKLKTLKPIEEEIDKFRAKVQHRLEYSFHSMAHCLYRHAGEPILQRSDGICALRTVLVSENISVSDGHNFGNRAFPAG